MTRKDADNLLTELTRVAASVSAIPETDYDSAIGAAASRGVYLPPRQAVLEVVAQASQKMNAAVVGASVDLTAAQAGAALAKRAKGHLVDLQRFLPSDAVRVAAAAGTAAAERVASSDTSGRSIEAGDAAARDAKAVFIGRVGRAGLETAEGAASAAQGAAIAVVSYPKLTVALLVVSVVGLAVWFLRSPSRASR